VSSSHLPVLDAMLGAQGWKRFIVPLFYPGGPIGNSLIEPDSHDDRLNAFHIEPFVCRVSAEAQPFELQIFPPRLPSVLVSSVEYIYVFDCCFQRSLVKPPIGAGCCMRVQKIGNSLFERLHFSISRPIAPFSLPPLYFLLFCPFDLTR
jgi:hypothetical protein